jgi:polysaccharide pyruvyl transferase WcaK-like protein
MLRFNRGQKRVPRQGNAINAVLRGSTENENVGDRLMWTVADTLLREMGVANTYRFAHQDRRFDAVPNPGKIDALFDLGNVYYCDSWPQPVEKRIRRSIRGNQVFQKARVVYLPCSWGPYRREHRSLLEELTRDAIIFARDRISLDYLNEALGSERAVFCPDLALMCEQEEPTRGADLLRELGISTQEPLLGLIPNARCVEQGVTPLEDPSAYHDRLQHVVQWARENGYQVVGLSHMVDTRRDLELLAGLGVPVIDSNDPLTIRSVIANLSAAVCSRYHGLVNCLVHGVPVVSLGWQHKYRGLMQYFDLQEFDHPLEQSNQQLSDRLLALTVSRDRLAEQIGDVLKQARSEIRASMGGMSSQLGGPSSVLTTPVRFSNAEIDTVSDQRSSSWARLLRRTRNLVAG